MFFLAALFDIQFPSNDGTCDNYRDQRSCVKRISFNAETYCTWSDAGTCEYQQPRFNLQLLLLVAWLQLVLSAPVDAFIRYQHFHHYDLSL